MTEVPSTTTNSEATDLPPLAYLADISTALLTPDQLHKLQEIAAARQLQVDSNASKEDAQELIRPFITWMHQQGLPKVLIRALGRCLWRHTTKYTINQLCALAIDAYPKGEEYLWNTLA